MLKKFIEHITCKERGKRNRETGNISFKYLFSFDSMHGTALGTQCHVSKIGTLPTLMGLTGDRKCHLEFKKVRAM